MHRPWGGPPVPARGVRQAHQGAAGVLQEPQGSKVGGFESEKLIWNEDFVWI